MKECVILALESIALKLDELARHHAQRAADTHDQASQDVEHEMAENYKQMALATAERIGFIRTLSDWGSGSKHAPNLEGSQGLHPLRPDQSPRA